jgi:hypothetical protein
MGYSILTEAKARTVIISINAEKSSTKFNIFMIKALTKLQIEKMHLNIIKAIYMTSLYPTLYSMGKNKTRVCFLHSYSTKSCDS